ncbi:MAG: ABC-F family ATP-binding cassette domain-containing protein [Candidatus Sericytochromatia bacterium]|nr:ABC-F family ATP-binding cassette domain-containing protein [Candidatus Sericytochromatia bacterium]
MLELNQVRLEFADRVLFKDVTYQLYPGHCYGLVGANGAGKSTLLKMLTGQVKEYSGEISWPKQASVGYLKQDHFAYENCSIMDTVIQGNEALWQARETQDRLTRQSDMDLRDAELYAEAEEVIIQHDGYSAESNAARLLDGLGIPAELHQNPLKTLSGGYKLRVLMAQLLFSKPDILLLDEPTNHLDIFSIKWLEQHLRDFPGLLIVVSHDRDFLNAVCSHIMDIDYGTVKLYTGNYDGFLAAKELEKDQKERALANQEKKKEDLQQFINRFKAKATKASQAQSRVKMLEKMEDIEIIPSSRRWPHFQFKPATTSGIIPLTLDGISKSFEDKQVLKQVSIEVERGDRLAIIGPNGVGKSTLLKIIMQLLAPDSGESRWGHEATPGYFPQDYHDLLKGDMTCYDWLYSFDATATIGLIRNLLGRMLFSGDDAMSKISTLSGGEATRLIFAKLMLEPSTVLVLDEPTNHLDLEAIDQLTEALAAYTGTLIFVSHNRYFVSRIATRILELKPDGYLDFRGTYPEYLEKYDTDHLSRDVSLKERTVMDQQVKNKQAAEGKKEAPAGGKEDYKAQKALRRKRQQLERKVEELGLKALELEEQYEQSLEPEAEARWTEALKAWKLAEEELAALGAES